jgi:signal transduction histidine kinase
MSLKTRWLASMLGVVFVGTAITTLISSSISFYAAERASYEWLSSIYRNTSSAIHQQVFQRLEVQARLLAHLPVLVDAVATRRASEIQTGMGSLWEPPDGGFWAVLGEDGTVLATSQPACDLHGARGQPHPTTGPLRSFLMCGRVPALAVTTEVRMGQGLQGWLVLGSQVNNTYADAIFAAASTEVVLLDREGLIASSFLDTSGKRVAPDLGAAPRDALWADAPHFGKYEIGVPDYRGYYGTTQPLLAGSSSLDTYLLALPLFPDQPQVPIRAVFMVPRKTMDQGAFYSTIIMVAFSLLLLPLLGLVVWRLVTGFVRPISQLGKMTAQVAEGDLSCQLPESRQDELGQLTRDFNDMVRKLRETQQRLMHTEKMAAVGQLAAGVGHEINNPLAYVTANLDFATETLSGLTHPEGGPAHAQASTQAQTLAEVSQAQTLAEVSQALQEAQDGARRVGRIVKDLRTFARQNDEEEKQVLEVRQVIEAALKFTANTLRFRARITRDFRETAPVEANEARLVQVFINLLVNAAQALPEGHAEEHEIRVTTDLDASGSVVVEVSDTGTGMSPEVLERIFEPFFTTKPVGQGTGLGLPICRNIIEGLGGRLTVQSTQGKGSTFRITLPAARPKSVTSEPTPPAPSTRKLEGRVLVVDDEPLIGASAKRILRSLCDVVVVTSPREALALVEAGQRFDLVLCDLMMPQMTGMELHGELSRQAPEVAARMIFLTGGAFTPDAQQFLLDKQWIEKPFDNHALRTCVSEWLRKVEQPERLAR